MAESSKAVESMGLLQFTLCDDGAARIGMAKISAESLRGGTFGTTAIVGLFTCSQAVNRSDTAETTRMSYPFTPAKMVGYQGLGYLTTRDNAPSLGVRIRHQASPHICTMHDWSDYYSDLKAEPTTLPF
jgi:hypothetical protein